MNAPRGFVEASLAGPGETLETFIAVAEVAAVKQGSQYGGSTKSLVV